MSDVEENKKEAAEKSTITDTIKGGVDKVKDKVKGALDADGDGKIEFDDIKDRAGQVGEKIKDGAGQVGGKIKDGAGALGGKIKDGLDKLGDKIGK